MILVKVSCFMLICGALADPFVEKLIKLEKQTNALETTVKSLESTTKTQLALIRSDFFMLENTVRNLLTKQAQFDAKLTKVEKAGTSGGGAGVHIQQYTMNALNDDTDSGVLKQIWYSKKTASSSLRVTWVGNVHVHAHTNKTNGCNRWYFTFNNNECFNPQKIDSLYYAGALLSDHHQSMTVDGVCNGIPAGHIQIGLNVGACAAQPKVELGDAYTGWDEPTSIIVQEI